MDALSRINEYSKLPPTWRETSHAEEVKTVRVAARSPDLDSRVTANQATYVFESTLHLEAYLHCVYACVVSQSLPRYDCMRYCSVQLQSIGLYYE